MILRFVPKHATSSEIILLHSNRSRYIIISVNLIKSIPFTDRLYLRCFRSINLECDSALFLHWGPREASHMRGNGNVLLLYMVKKKTSNRLEPTCKWDCKDFAPMNSFSLWRGRGRSREGGYFCSLFDQDFLPMLYLKKLKLRRLAWFVDLS